MLLIETQNKTSALKFIPPQKLTTIKTAITISRSNRDNKVQPALKELAKPRHLYFRNSTTLQAEQSQ